MPPGPTAARSSRPPVRGCSLYNFIMTGGTQRTGSTGVVERKGMEGVGGAGARRCYHDAYGPSM